MKKIFILLVFAASVAVLAFCSCKEPKVIATYTDGCYEIKILAPDTIKHKICTDKKK